MSHRIPHLAVLDRYLLWMTLGTHQVSCFCVISSEKARTVIFLSGVSIRPMLPQHLSHKIKEEEPIIKERHHISLDRGPWTCWNIFFDWEHRCLFILIFRTCLFLFLLDLNIDVMYMRRSVKCIGDFRVNYWLLFYIIWFPLVQNRY